MGEEDYYDINKYEIGSFDGMDITIHVWDAHLSGLDLGKVMHFASHFDDGLLWDFVEGPKNWFFYKCHMNESGD